MLFPAPLWQRLKSCPDTKQNAVRIGGTCCSFSVARLTFAVTCLPLRQSERVRDPLMPEFGSFSLLLALVLSAYTLVAGAIALRQLATGSRGRIAPDRLAETARDPTAPVTFIVYCAYVT